MASLTTATNKSRTIDIPSSKLARFCKASFPQFAPVLACVRFLRRETARCGRLEPDCPSFANEPRIERCGLAFDRTNPDPPVLGCRIRPFVVAANGTTSNIRAQSIARRDPARPDLAALTKARLINFGCIDAVQPMSCDPVGTYRRQSQQCRPPGLARPSSTTTPQRECACSPLQLSDQPRREATTIRFPVGERIMTGVGAWINAIAIEPLQPGYDRRPGSRPPLARYLNGEGIGPCVAGVCRVLECGFVELSKHSVCRSLHNARSRYDAFYPEREQAGSSGRDVEDARRIDTKSRQCSRYRTFRGVLRQRDGHQFNSVRPLSLGIETTPFSEFAPRLWVHRISNKAVLNARN